jgi:hypothetical protein
LFLPVLVVAGVLVVAAGGGTPRARADRPDGGPGNRTVAFTSSAQIVGGDSGCDPTVPTRCAGTFRSLRTFDGDLSGTAYVVGSAVLLADGTYQGQAVAQFTGTVEGCGSGTLVIVETGVLDPANQREKGTWTVVDGQGTGDLAQLTGAGRSDSAAGGTGRIRCR